MNTPIDLESIPESELLQKSILGFIKDPILASGEKCTQDKLEDFLCAVILQTLSSNKDIELNAEAKAIIARFSQRTDIDPSLPPKEAFAMAMEYLGQAEHVQDLTQTVETIFREHMAQADQQKPLSQAAKFLGLSRPKSAPSATSQGLNLMDLLINKDS